MSRLGVWSIRIETHRVLWTWQHIAVGKGNLADTGNKSAIAGSYVGMVMSVGASVGTQVEEIRQTP